MTLSNLQDHWPIIYMLIVVSLILGIMYVEWANAENIPEPILEQTECNLIRDAPFYDCSEFLLIIVFDVLYPPHLNMDTNEWEPTQLAYGTVYPDLYDTKTGKKGSILVIGNSTEPTGYEEDESFTTVLQHEIRHVICKCDFHPETTERMKEIEIFIFGPKLEI